MSRASKAIERVHQLREELGEEIKAVDNRISECRARMGLLERHGLVPEAEAVARFERDLDSMARKGEVEFQRMVGLYTSSGGTGASGIASTISARRRPNDTINDPGPVLVYLARDHILADARKVISEAYQGEKAQDRQVPAEEARRAELRQLEGEIEKLQAERDELQDELSRSFNFEPSQATQDRERREREQQILDGLNKSSREPSPEGAEVLRSPDVGQSQ